MQLNANVGMQTRLSKGTPHGVLSISAAYHRVWGSYDKKGCSYQNSFMRAELHSMRPHIFSHSPLRDGIEHGVIERTGR